MPPRLNKRQLREQEELSALSQPAAGESSAEEEAHVISGPGFAALFPAQDIDDADSDEPINKSANKRKSKKKKNTNNAPTPPIHTPSKVIAEPLSKKALKKAEARKKKAVADELDKALAEIALEKATNATPSAPYVSTSKHSQLPLLLAVSLQHLDSEAEMKKFFGAKVVQANKTAPANTPSSSRARQQGLVQRSNLTRPQPTWWNAGQREGLSLRALTEEEVDSARLRMRWSSLSSSDEKWWTVEYSKKYKSMTMAFMRTVLSGDPNGFWELVNKLPWHADTLLQLSEVYRHREEYASAFDFVERALFTYERAFIGSFNFTSGASRLDFSRVENRPFFLAIHRQVSDLQRRGCVRTSFEFARLMWSLDPAGDPHGALFHLEYIAIKAGMHQWLLDVWNHYQGRKKTGDDFSVDPTLLPGWTYSRSLALRMNEESQEHNASTEALKDAIRSFPSMVPLLADKLDVSLPGSIRGHRSFKIATDSSSVETHTSILHLMSHLYVQRAFSLWKDPEIIAWFTSTVIAEFGTNLPSTLSTTSRCDEFYRKYPVTMFPNHPAYSVYRHLIVLETTYRRLFNFMPIAVLDKKSLSCDPLPPITAVSEYNDEFFQGAEDIFAPGARARPRTRQERVAEQRMLARLIPDAAFREQLQALFDGHPQFANRFPGGVVQFAQMAAELPEEALEDIMLVQAMQVHEAEDRGMPGQMPGQPNIRDEPDLADVHNAQEDEQEIADDDVLSESGSDEDDEPVAPLPIRMLRNVMNRFWGGPVEPENSSSEDEQEETNPMLPGIDDGGGVD